MYLLMGGGPITDDLCKYLHSKGQANELVQISPESMYNKHVEIPNWHPMEGPEDELQIYLYRLDTLSTLKFHTIVWELPEHIESPGMSEVLNSYAVTSGMGDTVLPYLAILKHLAEVKCLSQATVSVFNRVDKSGTFGDQLTNSALQSWLNLVLGGTGTQLRIHSANLIAIHPVEHWTASLVKDTI